MIDTFSRKSNIEIPLDLLSGGDGSHSFWQQFGDLLIEKGFVERPSFERAMRAAEKTGERIDSVLTKLGLISDIDLVSAFGNYLNLPIFSEADCPISPILPERFSKTFLRLNGAIPINMTDTALTLLVLDPLDLNICETIGYFTGLPIHVNIATPAIFDRTLAHLYHDLDDLAELETSSIANSDANDIDLQRLRDIASEAPIIRLVNQMVVEAVESRASDIHLEPTIDSVLIRYRVDGHLRTAQTHSSELRAAITSRIKIMAKLDIAERRMPQDGRINMAVRGVDIDLRVSTIPVAYGESVVLRILDRTRVELNFQRLGFETSTIATLRSTMAEPNGIVLVTGPTGSGKTTTLYTVLDELNRPDIKIFTVEDPIEYQLEGINQVQVQSAIGMDFKHALRSILRQDPDIIMIGEIRDLETATIAIQASLTGHLVFSTLHTNSATATIARLIDMGVEPYLLGSTVRAILSQRLVRRLCTICSAPDTTGLEWISAQFPTLIRCDEMNVRKAVGCDKCRNTGYSGRTIVEELLIVDQALKHAIVSHHSESAIAEAAHASGMQTILENGVRKVLRGETAMEEILRVTRVN